MNILSSFGQHKRILIHSRVGSVGDFEWYECKNCDRKLFTVDGNIWGNDKWKDTWHKTPEEDMKMYDEHGKVREDYLESYFKSWGKV